MLEVKTCVFTIEILCFASAGIETFGKNAVVCGRSKNVGMPIAMLLHADGMYETKAGLYVCIILNNSKYWNRYV